MQEKVKTYTVSEATAKLENYCAYQERCHKEVVQKLREMRMIPQAIDHIVVHLINENYLNEERFARNFAQGKFQIKKWGRIRIQRELKMRGISQYNIQLAMQEIEETYYDVFEELAQTKYDSILEKNSSKARKKLADYLLYKGWESHLVYDKVAELYPF
ncbi:regulatory protein RecX [Capnocytophaga catalasegens]|uniref:Regulatory protein RecX n=1 Tax=Capnocytophaga catalasegens TaxID=1004260 RepID=A0AAV5AYG7_9FLAO|nr:regulatory protein RecX [Capnocytophaga catalasegens]GIZ15979.1 recombinase RecX [Capnocytophaga catalasegens]GJM50466.1 recombinase RecX [Capnocytophaga catalasegens]GJM53961.1 recombinase RecX [Capnocytophaga catalasegens]